ncbi:BLUF domain-containing protein [Roseomonas chloroacetimidivorans]|uniref:BLUF domain-containing protein n=1 Tax=Roseomonas chloroacetimidivorans TaxID=1766656 RepID=UPI003C73DD27
MPADAGAPSDQGLIEVPLRCVTFVSEGLIGGTAADWAAEIEDILIHSRRWNKGVNVTGALMLTDRHFAQVLEGPAPCIILTLDRIRRDPRHRILRIEERPLGTRRFGDWSMAYLGRRRGEVSVLTHSRPFFRNAPAVGPVLLMMQYLLGRCPMN